MATLTENLQTIYTVKNQIKEVIGTQSDLFSEYPTLISNAIEAGGEGLDWDDVATAGYIVPAGTLNVSANGNNIDVASYAYANVAVPIPAGYIQPSGTITIDDNYNNTTVDVTSYAYADVQISGGGSGTFDYDSCYSHATVFNEVSYSMFDLYNYVQSHPYGNGWTPKNIDTVIEGSSYIYQAVDFFTLGNIDLTTQFSGMSPDNTSYGEASYWKIYDAENYEQAPAVTSLFDFTTGDQWAHIQYENYDGIDKVIKFARVPMTWDSMGSQWNTDTETEINSMPVVEYSEINGASSTHNGTYLFLPDGGSIDLYIKYVAGDSEMDVPDRYEVYAGFTDNYGNTVWYNIEETPLSGVNFIEYDENNWPPQA